MGRAQELLIQARTDSTEDDGAGEDPLVDDDPGAPAGESSLDDDVQSAAGLRPDTAQGARRPGGNPEG